jgi:aldose 1-epimerase
MTLDLAMGSQRLTLDPALGGAVLRWRLGDTHLLRPTSTGAGDVLEAASFPLVPYANRIAGGRFGFGGRTAHLPPNMAGQRHPLHGDGWRGDWTVEAVGADHAELVFAPATSAWPWRYAARQAVRLEAGALVMSLAVTNLDDAPGPFGLGFHPYFPCAGQARLTADVGGVWLADAEVLPERWVAGSPLADWPAGAAVRGRALIDHCHTGWTGEARIDLGPGQPSLRLTASEALGCLHIYAPPDQDFFCVEPVSHVPNGVNMDEPTAHGVRVLAAGETLAAEVRLQIL